MVNVRFPFCPEPAKINGAFGALVHAFSALDTLPVAYAADVHRADADAFPAAVAFFRVDAERQEYDAAKKGIDCSKRA